MQKNNAVDYSEQNNMALCRIKTNIAQTWNVNYMFQNKSVNCWRIYNRVGFLRLR